MQPCLSTACCVLMVLGLFCPTSVVAQDGASTHSDTVRTALNGNKTRRTSPCFEGQDSERRRRRENEAIANLPKLARFWLTEDVAYLISPEERCSFLHLATDEERNQFIEQFWSRRAPDPTSLDNSFKETHYERIAFADKKYGTEIPGWKTDRGRVYVMFGPPDSVESHRSGEKTGRPPEEGVETYQYSWEGWHYRHLEGVGENLEFEFVDPSESGEYRLAMPPEMKDELIFAPPYNLGRSSRGGVTPESAQSIEPYIGPAPTPLVQFKDLEAIVVSRIVRDQVRFSHRIEFSKATNATTLARILVYLPNEQPSSVSNNGDPSTGFEVFGRISKPSGWVVETFERKISLERRRNSAQSQPDCQFDAAMTPGTYRLAIAVKNMVTEEVGTLHTAIDVPSYEKLNAKK
jgi:GWxTD domain-containing protein